MAPRPKVHVVLTPQSILPGRGAQTGWYLPELVHPSNKLAPYVEIVVASRQEARLRLIPSLYQRQKMTNNAKLSWKRRRVCGSLPKSSPNSLEKHPILAVYSSWVAMVVSSRCMLSA